MLYVLWVVLGILGTAGIIKIIMTEEELGAGDEITVTFEMIFMTFLGFCLGPITAVFAATHAITRYSKTPIFKFKIPKKDIDDQ